MGEQRQSLIWTSAILLIACQVASAHGQLKEMNTEKAAGHLVFPALSRHPRVNFCVRIDNSAQRQYSITSMETQTRAALGLWLSVVQQITGQAIAVELVSCKHPALNLLVDVGPETRAQSAGAYQHINSEPNRMYSYVHFDSAFKYISNGEYQPINDFAKLAEEVDGGRLTLVQVLTRCSEKRMTVSDFGDWSDLLDSLVGGSTYPNLIHEIGHAFGLCDTDKAHFEAKCDAKFASEPSDQPFSVMNDAGRYLYLTQDDEAGIASLVKRFGGSASAQRLPAQ